MSLALTLSSGTEDLTKARSPRRTGYTVENTDHFKYLSMVLFYSNRVSSASIYTSLKYPFSQSGWNL